MDGKFILILGITALVGVIFCHLIYHWLSPWLASRVVNRLLRDEREGKPRPPRSYNFEIDFDANGISVKALKGEDGRSTALAWNKITRATAFKRDLFVVDCICLIFETTEEMTLELDEEMKGWPEMTSSLPQHLPGCKELSEWIFQAASPAFATNPTEIFARS